MNYISGGNIHYRSYIENTNTSNTAELPFGEVVDGVLHHLGIIGILVGNGLLDRRPLHNLILNLFFTRSFTLVLNE